MFKHNNSIYEIVTVVSYDDLEIHFSKVLPLIHGTDEEWYKTRMRLGIDQGLAFEVLKDGIYVGHVYTRIEDDKFYGTSVLLGTDITTTVIAFLEIAKQTDRRVIRFMPHSVEQLKQFMSMLYKPSIRNFHSFGSTVSILRKDIVPRLERIYKYLRIEECQQ